MPLAAPAVVEEPFKGLAAGPDGRAQSAAADAFLYTAGIYGSQLLIFASGIVQKRLLGPQNAGYWALMGTFMTFFGLITLGAYEGVTRQVPMLRGRGDFDGAARVSDTGASFSLLVQAIFGTAIAVVAIVFGASWAQPIRWGLVFLGLSAPLRVLADCHTFILMATKRFNATAASLVLQGFLALAVQTTLVYLLGYYGMFIGLIVNSVGTLLLWQRMGLTSLRRPAFRWGIRRDALGQAIGIGLPIWMYAQIFQLFMAVDNLIVFRFIDARSLGYYALACSVTTYILFLPQGVGNALFPRMLEKYGSSGGDILAIRHYATDVQRILAYVLVPPAVIASYFLLPVLIRQALPSFLPAVGVVQIMVAASFFISIVQMPVKVLTAAGYRWQVTWLMLICLIINAADNYIATGVLHWGVRGAAGATSLSYLTLFLIMTSYALSKVFPPRRVARHVAELTAAGTYLLATVWGVQQAVGMDGGSVLHDLGFALLKCLLALALWTPWFAYGQRHYGAMRLIWSLARGAAMKVANLIRTSPPAKGTEQ